MDTTNPVYYQNTAETVSLDNLPTGQNNLLKHMTIPLISTDILVSVRSTNWHRQRACLSSLTETSTEALDLLNASGRALKNNYIPIEAQPYFRYNHCLTTWTTRTESLSTRMHTWAALFCPIKQGYHRRWRIHIIGYKSTNHRTVNSLWLSNMK